MHLFATTASLLHTPRIAKPWNEHAHGHPDNRGHQHQP
jgi:hypothetical protein